MTELKLKLPIKVLNHEVSEGEATNGFTIIDANESEFYFHENKETGEFEYDGCCVEPQQIEVITEHLQSETTEYSPYWDLVDAKAEQNNTIDLDAYAEGVQDGVKWQQEQMEKLKDFDTWKEWVNEKS
jgi:hypothetical protein